MKKYFMTFTLFIVVALCLSTAFAQYEPYTQMGLPDGAIARFSKGSIREITYSSDGTRVAVATTIGVWIYDAQTGEEQDLITGKLVDCSNPVVFSPDRKRIVTTNWWDKEARLWDTQTGKPIKTLTGHKSQINAIVYSSDSKTLATASADKTIRLWNAHTGRNTKTLIGHTKAVTSVRFSPDGKTIATGSADKTIKLWNVRTGKLIHTFNDLHSPIAFSPDGKTLLGINKELIASTS